MADTNYQPAVYRKQGGADMVIASGGTLTFESGAYILGDGLTIVPTGTLGTDNNKGVYIYSPNASTSFFKNTGNTKRSYLFRVEAYRPSTLPMGDGVGGVDDAAIFALYRSYAADKAYVQQRGLNVSVNHRGTSGGSVGNLISTNVSTSTTLTGDNIALTLSNENYAVAVGGVSGVLDCVFTHEGANATGGDFIVRLRNAKKNGSANGAYLALDDGTSTTALSYGIDMSAGTFGSADIRLANSICIVGLTTAITDNSTTTTLPEGSLAVTTNGTGKGVLYICDSGGKWQGLAQA